MGSVIIQMFHHADIGKNEQANQIAAVKGDRSHKTVIKASGNSAQMIKTLSQEILHSGQ